MKELLIEKEELEELFLERFEEDINKFKIDKNVDKYNYKNLLKTKHIEIMQELKFLGYEESEFNEFCGEVDICITRLNELKNKSNHVKTPNIISTAFVKRTRQEVSKILSSFESYR